MADQRPQFRFRLPWLSAPPAAVPPPLEGQAASAPAARRPPSSPVGVAQPPAPPVQLPPPPPVQATPTTEPPSLSQVASPPPSPSGRGTRYRVTSPAQASPSSAALPSQAATQPAQPQLPLESPPKSLSSPPDSSSQLVRPEATPPSSPSQVPPLVQPTTELPSPPKKQTSPPEESEREATKLRNIQPSTTQETEEKAALILEESKSDSKEQPQDKIQYDAVTMQPSQELGSNGADVPPPPAAAAPAPAETPALLQKSDLPADGMNLEALPESDRKVDEAKGDEEGQEIIGAAAKGQLNGKPKERAKIGIVPEKQVPPTETVVPTYPKVSKPLPKPPLSNGEKEIREDITKFVHKHSIKQARQPVDDKPYSIITLAGENRGASMHLGSEPAKGERSIHIQRGYKINPDESIDTTTDGEGSSRERKSGLNKAEEDSKAMKACINSNVQGINNSLVCNSSVIESNPGVELVRCSQTEAMKLKKDASTAEALKAEFNITPSEKLTYAPKVRRRCLRGLFMESSDPDSDNPEKPRRHGCRFGYKEKTKDSIVDAL
ncbi:hypothetical protein Nepgr_006006 [Nepenthes gracilis]|uniref:Uncharacterized protein n=1 Tax=Nepenthes gracilis TaxID=150966 RepID=A0AAD3XGZ3_NEPGR|nr:hypothetical protein Nepgr_006006 [Nepenthes gracilis]